MHDTNLLEVAQALSQIGKAALWLGASWQPPRDDDALDVIASTDWIGVWSDSRDPSLADWMESSWLEADASRRVVLVPDTLEEALGDRFRFSDFAPYMFLRGRGDKPDPLDDIAREDSRLDKIRQLARAQGAVLLAWGFPDCHAAIDAAIQAGRRAPELRSIVLCGHDSHVCAESLRARPDAKALTAKITTFPGPLVELIQRAQSLTIPHTRELLRLGDTDVPLAPLLRQEPPVTQSYAILRTHDISPNVGDNESTSAMLTGLLTGSNLPWRSIACGLAWDGRPERSRWQQQLSDAITLVRRSMKKIVVIDADVEPGSGTTVLLAQLVQLAISSDTC